MPRLNKATDRVFADIAETPQKKASYDTFLDVDRLMGVPESRTLLGLKKTYREMVYDSKGTIDTLAAIEEIIIQIRCKEVINSELRLSLSRNYIYARSTFYRRDNQINDIRTIIGTTEEFGDDLDLLSKDELFNKICVTKLTQAMNSIIDSNILTLKTLTRV